MLYGTVLTGYLFFYYRVLIFLEKEEEEEEFLSLFCGRQLVSSTMASDENNFHRELHELSLTENEELKKLQEQVLFLQNKIKELVEKDQQMDIQKAGSSTQEHDPESKNKSKNIVFF